MPVYVNFVEIFFDFADSSSLPQPRIATAELVIRNVSGKPLVEIFAGGTLPYAKPLMDVLPRTWRSSESPIEVKYDGRNHRFALPPYQVQELVTSVLMVFKGA